MAGRYATNTQVSIDRSKEEIENTLRRYGADQCLSGWDKEKAYIMFRIHDRMVKFTVDLPDKDDEEFTLTPTGRERDESTAFKEWEQACKQRWRALALIIKAKLEAVECGVCDFEEEFLGNIMLPDGRTASDYLKPQLEVAYQKGGMPTMLPWTGKGEKE